MDYYNPNEVMGFNLEHDVKYTFMYESGVAEVISSVSGNIAGANVLNTDLEMDLTAPFNNEINQKYVVFDEEDSNEYRYVDALNFHYPNGNVVEVPIDNCQDHLVKVEILKYKG
ncbi:hypothetical protein ACI2JA_03360 [Alkalihalobacillus sp. NPDC078783]